MTSKTTLIFSFNVQRRAETLRSVHRSPVQPSGHCPESPDWGKPSPRQEREQTTREGADPRGWCRVTGDSASSGGNCGARSTVSALNNLTSDWSGPSRMRSPRESLDASTQPLSEPAVGNITATSLFSLEPGRSCYNVPHRCPSTSRPIPGRLSGAVE